MNRSASATLRILIVAAIAVAAGVALWFLRAPAGLSEPNVPGANPPASADKGPPWLADITTTTGIDFTHRNGQEAEQATILESLGGGIGLIDYDGDGLLDIFATGGGSFEGPSKTEIRGHPCKLYRNLGNLKFQDVTEEAGLSRTWMYNHGLAVADYDRDGWPDLLVTGFGRVLLFHNEAGQGGQRRFVEVSEKLGLKDSSWSTSAGWGDVNGDGFPEVYICHYVDWSFANHPRCPGPNGTRQVCEPQRFQPLVHSLFENKAGRGFTDTAAARQFTANGCGLGVVLADVNGDGRPDIYVANDATNNLLYLNRGGGRVEERGRAAGVAVDDTGHFNGSMGTDAADYDGSGRASLFVTNYQNEYSALYQNLGKEVFSYQSRGAGIAAIGTSYVSFGTGFVDFDNDGWEDLIFVNGHVLERPSSTSSYLQKPLLLRNVEREGRRMFEDAGGRGGEYFRTPALGRGLAVGDLDNDGWPDLVISHTNSPVAVLRNVAAEANPKSRWIGFRLLGRDHRDIVGSTLTVEGSTRKITRFAKGGGSYLSAGDPRLLVGLGESETIRKVTVNWSWGETQSWEGLEPEAYWDLREGDSKTSRSAAPR